MSKQAVLMVVDVGNSMDEIFSQGSSRAKIALECCKLTLQQKIFNNASHELGLILFGDNETDDGNSLLLQPLEKPKIDFVRKVQQLSQARFDNPRAGGDVFSAINFSVGVINQHCGKKKYNKRLFLFTSGMGETDFDYNDLNTLSNKLIHSGIKINIVPIDFMVSYNPSENALDGEMFMEPVQEKNSQLLIRFKELTPDNVQIFPASMAIQLYKRFRRRDTNPVAKYKGSMEIAPGLEIDVCTYKAIRRQKLKSLARYDASVPFQPEIKTEKEVIIDTNYIFQGDESGKLVDSEDIINAYSYGPQLVPISSILQAGSKVYQEKNLKFLGFVQKSKVPRHCLMGEADIVIPSDNPVGRKLFTSFIYSMISLNKYAIARYVARNMKNGVNPRLVVLIPHRNLDKEMFYLVELPTVEDVRDYPFNTLKKSTERQSEIVRYLIEKMMLCHKQGDQFQQQVKIESTFNPTRQYFYQMLFYRALNQDATDIPPLDPVIKNYMTPEAKIYEKTIGIMKNLKKEFRLVKKLNLEEKRLKNSKALQWKDIIGQVSNTDKNSIMSEETQEAEFVKPDMKFMADLEDEDIKFNPINPVGSFKKMVSFNKKDLVGEGLKYMTNYIMQKLSFCITNEAYKHLKECAEQMRTACISEREQIYWDDWFTELGVSQVKFYDYLRSQGLGLIKGSNTEIFRPLSFHEEIVQDIEFLD